MKKYLSMLLAAVLACTCLSGCGKEEPKNVVPTVESDAQVSADVVIVGAGGAGLAAAIEAVDNGAESVVILERTSKTGGSLNFTSGSMSGAETVIQEIDGIEDTIDSYVADIMKNGAGLGNEELIRMYAEEDVAAIQWLWDNGLSEKKFTTDREGHMSVFAPEHALYSIPRTYKASPTDRANYKSAAHEILDSVVNKYSQIKVEYNTEAVKLVNNEQGQVLSVVGNHLDNGKTTLYTASKGVILATGGYSGNQKLMGEYAKYGSSYLAGGSSNADGSSFVMAQEVGAYVDEETMTYIPTFPMGLEIAPGMGTIAPTYTWKTGGICVNKNGERFVDETEDAVEIREEALNEQPDALQYDIFTDVIVEDLIANNAAIFWQYFYAPGMPYNKYVVSASSLEELAEKIDVPYETLKTTVDTYNTNVESQTTDEFGRQFTEESKNTYNLAINKIEGATYYAVPLKALCVMTLGGLTVNNQMQVVDAAGNAIPGLYAAGECVGGVWGKYVSGGTGVMGPIVFGRLAARTIMNSEVSEEFYQITPATNMLSADLFVKEEAPQESYDMTGVKDGEYSATVDGQNGEMVVNVTVSGGKITAVVVASNNETESIAAGALEEVPAAIVEANTPVVDVVSGATLTSNRIMDAVKQCLEQSKN